MLTTNAKTQDLRFFIERLNDFGSWLLSLTPSEFSLSLLAERVCHFFAIEYCCIHICAHGRWHNQSGNFAREFHPEIPDSLKRWEDRPFGTLDLAEEQALDVRNFPIQLRNESTGLLVVKSDSLSNDAIRTIATMIALFCAVLEIS